MSGQAMSGREAEPPDSPPPEPPPEGGGNLRKGTFRRRLALLVLAGGAALVGSRLLPLMPEPREVSLELEDPSKVLAVELVWTRTTASGELEEEPAGGARRTFGKGEAPRRVPFRLSVADGTYEVRIALDREDGAHHLTRRIDFSDAERVVLPVRLEGERPR